MPSPTVEAVRQALTKVIDPEIKRPITDLGMVDDVIIDGTTITARILLTVSGCPMKERLTNDVTAAIVEIAPDHQISVDLGVMTDDQRKAMQESLRGGQSQREIPFNQPGSLTKVFAIASGKGGVGKSSVTVNLAVAMAARGLKVGLLDADIYGHSIPDMLGVGDRRPTQVEDMIMPVPVPTPSGTDIQVISIGMLKPRRDQVVAWRGPMLDRALVQMLSDVYWGDLDVLLLDLPPGTGDMAISLGQHLANAEVIVVTTPQPAAATVAERAGTMASMLHQRVIGVVENMTYLDTGDGTRLELFGSGGAKQVAATLSERFGYDVSVLGEIPLDPRLREGGDSGAPIVATHPDAEASKILQQIADDLTGRARGLSGMQLGLSPAGR